MIQPVRGESDEVVAKLAYPATYETLGDIPASAMTNVVLSKQRSLWLEQPG